MYLKCSSNNRADTVFYLFFTTCNNIGIPSRVRSDCGGENVLVATVMSLYMVLVGKAILLVSQFTTRRLSISGEICLYHALAYFIIYFIL